MIDTRKVHRADDVFYQRTGDERPFCKSYWTYVEPLVTDDIEEVTCLSCLDKMIRERERLRQLGLGDDREVKRRLRQLVGPR